MRSFFLTVFLLAALAVIGVGGWAVWWVYQPLPLRAPTIDLSIEPGTLPRGGAPAGGAAGVGV